MRRVSFILSQKVLSLGVDLFLFPPNYRESANILFTDLLIESKGNSAQHAIFGPIMSKYLERMAKSNDQILRLAEIISKEEQTSVSTDDIFNKINET